MTAHMPLPKTKEKGSIKRIFDLLPCYSAAIAPLAVIAAAGAEAMGDSDNDNYTAGNYANGNGDANGFSTSKQKIQLDSDGSCNGSVKGSSKQNTKYKDDMRAFRHTMRPARALSQATADVIHLLRLTYDGKPCSVDRLFAYTGPNGEGFGPEDWKKVGFLDGHKVGAEKFENLRSSVLLKPTSVVHPFPNKPQKTKEIPHRGAVDLGMVGLRNGSKSHCKTTDVHSQVLDALEEGAMRLHTQEDECTLFDVAPAGISTLVDALAGLDRALETLSAARAAVAAGRSRGDKNQNGSK